MNSKTLKLGIVARTDVGRIREINEDNFIVTRDFKNQEWHVPQSPFMNSVNGTVMVVADGLGGLNAGEVASKITVDSIRDFLANTRPATNENVVKEILFDAIAFAHAQILEYGRQNRETQGMGSTVVVGLIRENTFHLAWSGDSRCYLFADDKLVCLTRDHSYVQRLVDEGKLSQDQAFLHPDSNIITQSLGDREQAPEPDYRSVPLADRDCLLLCSDGLNSMLHDREIAGIVSANKNNLSHCAAKLMEAALEAGGADNITILLSQVIAGAGISGTDRFPDEPSSVSAISTIGSGTRLKPIKGNRSKKMLVYLIPVILLAAVSFFYAPSFLKPDRNRDMIKEDSTKSMNSNSSTNDDAGTNEPDSAEEMNNRLNTGRKGPQTPDDSTKMKDTSKQRPTKELLEQIKSVPLRESIKNKPVRPMKEPLEKQNGTNTDSIQLRRREQLPG